MFNTKYFEELEEKIQKLDEEDKKKSPKIKDEELSIIRLVSEIENKVSDNNRMEVYFYIRRTMKESQKKILDEILLEKFQRDLDRISRERVSQKFEKIRI